MGQVRFTTVPFKHLSDQKRSLFRWTEVLISVRKPTIRNISFSEIKTLLTYFIPDLTKFERNFCNSYVSCCSEHYCYCYCYYFPIIIIIIFLLIVIVIIVVVINTIIPLVIVIVLLIVIVSVNVNVIVILGEIGRFRFGSTLQC